MVGAELVERPQAGVGDDRVEPVGVAGHPVGHVAAERAAHRGGAGGVDPRVGQAASVAAIRSVERGTAPRAPAPLNEVLAVAGGQRRVGQQHRIARARPSATDSTASDQAFQLASGPP